MASVVSSTRICKELSEKNGSKILIAIVIEPNASLPSLVVRNEIIKSWKARHNIVERGVAIVEGDGFQTTSVRNIFSGILLFTAPRYPYKVFADPGAASKFLVGGGDSGDVPPHIMMRAIQTVRRRKV